MSMGRARNVPKSGQTGIKTEFCEDEWQSINRTNNNTVNVYKKVAPNIEVIVKKII